jgi:hypothetical protein
MLSKLIDELLLFSERVFRLFFIFILLFQRYDPFQVC